MQFCSLFMQHCCMRHAFIKSEKSQAFINYYMISIYAFFFLFLHFVTTLLFSPNSYNPSLTTIHDQRTEFSVFCSSYRLPLYCIAEAKRFFWLAYHCKCSSSWVFFFTFSMLITFLQYIVIYLFIYCTLSSSRKHSGRFDQKSKLWTGTNISRKGIFGEIYLNHIFFLFTVSWISFFVLPSINKTLIWWCIFVWCGQDRCTRVSWALCTPPPPRDAAPCPLSRLRWPPPMWSLSRTTTSSGTREAGTHHASS